MEDDPFPDLNIADTSALANVEGRTVCHLCGRKRRYFCYSCCVYLNGVEKLAPCVEIPVHIDIIKHKQELDSKSTAVHAVLLCPDQVSIHSFPDIPTYDPVKDILVFPAADSLPIKDLSAQRKSTANGEQEGESQGKIIFIDCTWNQIHPIIIDPRLKDLPKVVLQSYETKFWRPNGSRYSNECLATIEAIYYFLREYHETYLKLTYNGEYDDILFLFKFLYLKIKDYHGGGHNLKAYKKCTENK